MADNETESGPEKVEDVREWTFFAHEINFGNMQKTGKAVFPASAQLAAVITPSRLDYAAVAVFAMPGMSTDEAAREAKYVEMLALEQTLQGQQGLDEQSAKLLLETIGFRGSNADDIIRALTAGGIDAEEDAFEAAPEALADFEAALAEAAATAEAVEEPSSAPVELGTRRQRRSRQTDPAEDEVDNDDKAT